MLNTPILFLVFNRPDQTRKVFKKIREAKPKKLFVAADGPRAAKDGENEKCELVRKIAIDVDWDCELYTLFGKENLGCGLAVSSAITWFFDNVEQGIILEDDTIPNNSFFAFCENMLHKYKEDDSIMHIGGNNFQFGKIIGNGSYYFSKFAHVWGWATWKRAWDKYNYDIVSWSSEKKDSAFLTLRENVQRDYWRSVFNDIAEGIIDTWDYQWQLSIWYYKGKCIIPNKNLIQNIGFGEGATHTVARSKILESMRTKRLSNFIEPVSIDINDKADTDYFNYIFLSRPPLNRRIKITNILRRILRQYFI
jgi:hypothetical protein